MSTREAQAPRHTYEHLSTPDSSINYEVASQILSDDSVQGQQAELHEEKCRDPELSSYLDLQSAQVNTLNEKKQAQWGNDVDTVISLEKKIDDQSKVLRKFDDDTRAKARDFVFRQGQLEKKTIVLQPDDKRSVMLVGLFDSAEAIQPDGNDLAEKTFLPGLLRQDGAYRADIFTPKGQEFEVPLNLIVEAGGFESWEGRGLQGGGEKEMAKLDADGRAKRSSREVIEYYAGLDSAIPPVDVVNVFIQPNGVIACAVPHDSHRTAAAMLRGQETIQARSLRFIRLEKDFIT